MVYLGGSSVLRLARKSPMSRDEFKKYFLKEPNIYFRSYRGDRYNWSSRRPTGFGEVTFDDIYVKNRNEQVGYIHNFRMSPKSADVTVQHISTATTYTRIGIAPIMARHFAWKLARLYGTKNIFFDETHPEYQRYGYDNFFERIGAKKLPNRNNVWRWDVANYRI